MDERDRIRKGLEGALAGSAPSLPTPPEIDDTVTHLASDAMRASLAADPYWPKWASPWWRMTLLFEMGLAAKIPRAAVDAMVAAFGRTHQEFPFRLEDVPAGVDPYHDVMCHCAMGTVDRVLRACGVDVDRTFPWVRGWYRTYQMADGGLNCDEGAYVKPTPRSSMISTLPPMEALFERSDASPAEESALDRAAEYLLARRLHRSLSKGGAVIDPNWLAPAFPRFYEYDVLRGLSFVARWAERRSRQLDPSTIVEVVEELGRRTLAGGSLAVGRRAWAGARTMLSDGQGAWTRGHDAQSFPLLEAVGTPGQPDPWLTREWQDTARRVAKVIG